MGYGVGAWVWRGKEKPSGSNGLPTLAIQGTEGMG